MSNPDVEEVERYNLEAKRKTCRHEASVEKYNRRQVGFGRHCPDCDTKLGYMDSARLVYGHWMMYGKKGGRCLEYDDETT